MSRRLSERPIASLMLGSWLPVALYVAIIFMLSARPDLGPPLNIPLGDKLAHLLEYGGLGALLGRAVMATWRGSKFVHVALVAVCLGIGVATADELFQSTVPGRQADVFDLMADAAGLGLAQLVLRAIVRA
jgi:VanZ family protein